MNTNSSEDGSLSEQLNNLNIDSSQCCTQCISLLVDNDADIRHTAVHVAAQKGHAECLQLLIHKGADIESTSYQDGYTALHLAAQHGHLQAISVLLEYGASILKSSEWNGTTALILAVEENHADCVKAILDKAFTIQQVNFTSDESDYSADDEFDIDHNDLFYYQSAFFTACERGHNECAKLLIENGANINLRPQHPDSLYLPIMVTAYHGNIELTRLLLDRGVDIECFDQVPGEEDDITIDHILHGTSDSQLTCKEMILSETQHRLQRAAFDSFINHHIEYPPLINNIYSTCYPSGDLRIALPVIGWDRAEAVRNKFYFDEVLFYVHLYVAKSLAMKTNSSINAYLASSSDDTSTLMTVLSDRLKRYLKP